jgi:hypothetical protein
LLVCVDLVTVCSGLAPPELEFLSDHIVLLLRWTGERYVNGSELGPFDASGARMKETDPTSALPLRFGWPMVFLANLPVPLLFGCGVCDWSGRIGMFAAIGLLYVLGREICRRVRGLDLIMICGGVLVALSQVYPMIHIFSAGLAFRTAERLGLLESTKTVPNVTGAFTGCIVTLLTGGMLLAIAAVAGLSYPIAKMMPDPHHTRSLSKSAVGLDDLA